MKYSRKVLSLLMIVAVISTSLFSSFPVFAASKTIKVKINGKLLKGGKKSYKVSRGYLIPAKHSAKAMGAKYTYKKSAKTIVIKKGKKTIQYKLNTRKAYVNKKYKKTAVKTVIRNKILYVDGKHLAHQLGFTSIKYDKKKRVLSINSVLSGDDDTILIPDPTESITATPETTQDNTPVETPASTVEATATIEATPDSTPSPVVTEESTVIPTELPTNVTNENSADISNDTPANFGLPTDAANEKSHKALPADKYYFYNTLSGKDKIVYERLVAAIEKNENAVEILDLGYKTTDNEVLSLIVREVLADHPQWFWVTRHRAIMYMPATSEITSILLLYTDGTNIDTLTPDYQVDTRADKKVIAKQISQFNKKVDEIIRNISPDLSDVEKEKLIHDYIVENVVYDNSALDINATFGCMLPNAFDAYGAVCENLAVCEGYSKMFQYLCYCVGINATQVMGTSSGSGHMWNTVNLDGEWYHVDTTWNDTALSIQQYYKYFNVTTDEITKADHLTDETLLPVPVCNSTKYAFTKTFGMEIKNLFTGPQNYKTALDYAHKLGSKFIAIKVKNPNTLTRLYVDKHFKKSNSEINSYITEKGYSMSFGSNIIIGEYLYLYIE